MNVKELLKILYGAEAGNVYRNLAGLIHSWQQKSGCNEKRAWVTENDIMLITYGDSVRNGNERPLVTLAKFLDRCLKDTVTAVHILPMYPYTSDDGFSVVDYYKINEELGSWEDIRELSNHYDLMFDAVVNHISRSSSWFQNFLECREGYKDYFITADPNADYSEVIRPRVLPLLTAFETKEGKKYVWTTFSDDQIDLNLGSPQVLMEILNVVLTYAWKGARFIRLDAIGFIWKKAGTTCMHLEETHAVVKLMRWALEQVFPGTVIITETNVPHEDNIGYFGNGCDEAQMVYQFPLPPLVLFSFMTGNAGKLSQWAKSLEDTRLSEGTTYFNFLASHDGIGMRPTEGMLTGDEKDLMVSTVLKHGGKINYRSDSDGTKTPYELNINYMDALTDPMSDNIIERTDKFLAAQSILLAFQGVPGIYIHSMLGSQNWYEGVEQSGINRRINREKLDYGKLLGEVKDKGCIRGMVLERFSQLIRLRRKQSAFSPAASQRVELLEARALTFIRYNEVTGQRILVAVNVSGDEYSIEYPHEGEDIIAGEQVKNGIINMKPYQTRWIVL